MPSNPSNPRQRRARTNKGTFVPDDPTTPEVNEAWTEVESQSADVSPLRKPAGKPAVRKRVGKPTVGAIDKITKPTFGVVRGVYN
jgi:hypothetical protein